MRPTARRHLALPARGRLLVSADVHGDGESFARVESLWRELRAEEPETHWVQLGDVVHGPSDEARRRAPELYAYEDASAQIVARLIALQREAPGRVHFVLGNHDYAHIGGPVTRKFFDDEPAALEARMAPAEVAAMRALFERALLAVSTPCGALLSHGAPNALWSSLDELDAIASLPPTDRAQRAILSGLLFAYGQPVEVVDRLLARLSAAPGYPHGGPLTFVVHGHDRDEEGFFLEGHNQLCPVIFGAPRAARRVLLLDLTTHYEDARALREGVEIVRLFAA